MGGDDSLVEFNVAKVRKFGSVRCIEIGKHYSLIVLWSSIPYFLYDVKLASFLVFINLGIHLMDDGTFPICNLLLNNITLLLSSNG